MQRQEVSHNTPAQIRGYIGAARVLVDELDLPDDLRAVAFGKAVDLFAAKQILLQEPQPVHLPTLGRMSRSH